MSVYAAAGSVRAVRAAALEVPAPSAGDVARLTRPQACLTLDQIDRHTAEKVLGKRAAAALAARH